MITRKIYSNVSYNFDLEVKKGEKRTYADGGLRLIAFECVESVFTHYEMMES